MKTSYVYGLFDALGVCLYVGQSANPKNRWQGHKSARFKDIPCAMRVLRKCATEQVDRLEVQMILAYRRHGQAAMNRTLSASGRPPIEDECRASGWCDKETGYEGD